MTFSSITGITNMQDVKCINNILSKDFINNFNIVCGFCSSYKRINDIESAGAHSPSLKELVNIISSVQKRNNIKFMLHHKVENSEVFFNECCKLLSFKNLQSMIDIIQLTSLWVNVEELRKLKSTYKEIEISLQIPIYKMKIKNYKEIGEKLSAYVDIVTYITIDNSGGRGIKHDYLFSAGLINYLKSKNIKYKWILAGGITSDNISEIINEVYTLTGEYCSVDSESKLHNGKYLDYKSVYSYIKQGYLILK